MSTWTRVTRRDPCPICKRPNWCTRTAEVVKCMRVPSDRPVENGGWLHDADGAPVAVDRPEKARPLPQHELELLARQCRTACSPMRLERFAVSLGLTVESLKRLSVGWSDKHSAWTFPMVDSSRRVLGIRLRTDQGRKISVKGGHEGLFIPADTTTDGMLIFCEGPTSCAALLDLGFPAVIGRPSCTGGVELVRDVLRAGRRRDVVIFGDHDDAKPLPNGQVFCPGQDGAERLSLQILSLCKSVRVVVPPFAKDSRDWKKAGATRAVIEAVIRATNYVRRAS